MNASVLSSMVVMVTWEEVPEISQNGIIITYEVLLQPTTVMVVTKNSSELTINVTGLLENVLYNITVRAYTTVGPGIYSSPPIQVMTHEDSKSCMHVQSYLHLVTCNMLLLSTWTSSTATSGAN